MNRRRLSQTFDGNALQFVQDTITETVKVITQPRVNSLGFHSVTSAPRNQDKQNLISVGMSWGNKRLSLVNSVQKSEIGNGFNTPADLFGIELGTRTYVHVHKVVGTGTHSSTVNTIVLLQDSTSVIHGSGYLQHKTQTTNQYNNVRLGRGGMTEHTS